MTYYIGLTANKGVGKSSFAQMLAEEIPNAEVVAFADNLRTEVEVMLYDHTFFKGGREWLEERKSSVFGPLLQGYGEFARQYWGDDYWINALEDNTFNIDTVIIPDVRYVNEAEWIKESGGLLVAIIGPSRWPDDQRDPNHPSEANVRRCQEMADMTVPNFFGLESLRNRAKDVANRVLLREAVS